MPPRPSHIPHSNERTALQRMSVTKGRSSEELHPAVKQTVATMLAKGWIERRSNDRGRPIYFITEAGQAALKAPIPGKS
jgi:DNA-binding MarR family transcriptional regulator